MPEFGARKTCSGFLLGICMEIKQFIKEVRRVLLNSNTYDSYVESTCPDCYGHLAILNSHRCSDGWNRYHTLVKNGLDINNIVDMMKKRKDENKLHEVQIEN